MALVETARSLPILMFHSTAPLAELEPYEWLQDISTSLEMLEHTFEIWKRRGYRTVSLAEASDFLDGRCTLPRGSLVLTLDDGYLDNWVGLVPLLEAFDFVATVFVTTDFIESREGLRPQFARSSPTERLQWKGYLSWTELRSMEQGGHIDVQSHATTHTWHFISPKIVDYYRPDNVITRRDSMLRFLWLNENRDRKPFALAESQRDSVPWGTPVYEYRPAIAGRRYFPDPAETERLVKHVVRRGGERFFGEPSWRAELDGIVTELRAHRPLSGRWETATERRERLWEELARSRDILARGLAKDIAFLSFPQGGVDPLSESLAADVGYRRWTMSSHKYGGRNRPEQHPRHLYRCGTGYRLFGETQSARLKLLSQEWILRRHFGRLSVEPAIAMVTLSRQLARLLGRSTER